MPPYVLPRLRTVFALPSTLAFLLPIFIVLPKAQPLFATQWAGMAAAETYTTAGEDPLDIQAIDFNSDGILDLAVVHQNDNVTIRLGNGSAGVGDGTFGTQIQVAVPPALTGMTFGHFNGDSHLDLAMAQVGDVRVSLGDGSGAFLSTALYPTGGGLTGRIQTADFNGDSILDLVVTHVLDSTVSVLLGNGSGGVGDGTFGTAATFSTGTWPRDVKVADFDGDTIPDLATANSQGDSISILLGNGTTVGDGTFATAVDYPVGGGVLDVEVADVNDDSILDLVFTEIDSHVVKALLGDGSGGIGDGTFSGPVTSSAFFHQWNAVVGDFDGDTIPDVATATFSSRRASVFLGASDGSFDTQRSYPAAQDDSVSQPTAIVTGDFDEDGWLDLATCNQESDRISVFLNVGEAPAEGAVIVSEVMADPYQVEDSAGEYVEIYNNTSRTLHLDRWSLETALGSRLLGGVVDPGDFLVVGASSDLDGAGFAPDFVPGIWPLLDDAGDSLVLRDSSETVYAQVDFTGAGLFGSTSAKAGASGVSAELVNLLAAVSGETQPQHYVASTTPFGADLGSPGVAGATSSAATATVTPSVAGGGSGNGTLSPDVPQVVSILDSAVFLLTPDPGYSIAHVAGTCGGSLAGTTFTTDPVVADCTVEASFLASTETTIQAATTLPRVGQPVLLTAEVSGTGGPPNDGQVQFVASTGETCVDSTVDVDGMATFACELTFAAVGNREVTATFSGSATHSSSPSSVLGLAATRHVDLSVVADDGQETSTDGDAVAYLIRLRNDGPDEAPGSRLVATADPSLDGEDWTCVAVGSAVCPPSFGGGGLDLTVDLPAGSGLDVTFTGNVPAGWTDRVVLRAEALASGIPPHWVYDPQRANDISIDVNNVDRPWVGLSAADVYSVGDAPMDVVSADFDGDGILDLASAHQGDSTVSVRLGESTAGLGTGAFGAPVTSAASFPIAMVAHDVDGDGTMDLVTASAQSSTSGGGSAFGVLLGQGDGSFASELVFDAGGFKTDVLVEDLNGDQIPDLAATELLDDEVVVLLGQGTNGVWDGTYAAPAAYATGDEPRGLVTGDFNGDDVPDLATANGGTSDVSVFLGTGSGVFQTAVDYAVGAVGSYLATGDFNEDGILDLALAATSPSSVRVLPGQGSGGVGDGTFGAPISSALQRNQPFDVEADDFDGDGLLDLVIAQFDGTSLEIVLGQGDGTFEASRLYPVGPDANDFGTAVTVGDFDGDAAPDVALTAEMENELMVLHNVGTAPTEGALLFTEVMGDPDQVEDEEGEYVEIYNNTGHALDLRHWTFGSLAPSPLSGVIPSRDYFVVAGSVDLDDNGFPPDLQLIIFPALDGSFPLFLRDSSNTEFARVQFSDDGLFGEGVSYELAHVEAGVAGETAEADYFPSFTPFGNDFGSPGSAGRLSEGTVRVIPVAQTGGTLDPSLPQQLPLSETISFTSTPHPGYTQGQVTSTCGGTFVGGAGGGVFTTDPVDQACFVRSVFISDSTSQLASIVGPVRVGQQVAFTVQVKGTAAPPADGAVEIVSSGGESCVATEPSAGIFTCSLAFTDVGDFTVSATFSGSETHTDSAAAAIDVDSMRFADVGVSADDGQDISVDGDPVAYLIEVRNDGPDEAPNTRLVAAVVPQLDDAEWQCVAVGGAVCPAPSGVGDVDLTATLPLGGGLDIVHGGTVPAGWEGLVALGAEAIVELDAPGEVHETDPSDNFATDFNNSAIFADGFESGDVNAWSVAIGASFSEPFQTNAVPRQTE